MNGDRLEQLVLSGELFRGPSRSSSPTRSASPDGHSEGSDDDGGWGKQQISEETDTQTQHTDSIGMGPGRTGVKGVIRDRDEAAARQRTRKAEELAELASRMERANLGGKTYLEEQDEHSVFGGRRRGRFGHLREVGLKGFVPAVEEDSDVWVVVHIYDPSLNRCDNLDERLMRIAREHPETKFIRCRASAIGFASTSNAKARGARAPSSGYLSKARTAPRLTEKDEDDPYADDVDEDEQVDEYGDEDEDDVDTDMLPTMLVYRSGDLVHNWVRVDWEAGALGIDELLERYVTFHSFGHCIDQVCHHAHHVDII
ncbi:thioredoxin-like protein [Gloeopeniophorella convolvens]|nr:thioredoxin-like protein [Gloeopeniophorella convolvens]